jgi:6-phosphogluconolactonase (cycloisomerase 2 family)
MGLSSLASRYLPVASGAARGRLYAAAWLADGCGAVHAFATEDLRSELLGSFACQRPVALALHPRLPVLYVANDCATWQDRPRATVEALALGPDGAPSHSLARHPLALSALAPRSLAISADGRYLLVSAFEGGAWNSFSLDKNGIPAPNPAALKEVGSGSSLPGHATAHPHSILPVHSGAGQSSLFVGSDYGADRLSLLEAYTDTVPGYEPAALAARYRHQLPAASGAMHLALHSQSGLVVASTLLQPALHSFRVTPGADPALTPLQSLPLESAPSAIALHPRAGILYVAHSAAGRTVLTLWQAAGRSGTLHRLAEQDLPAKSASSLAVQANRLWVAGPAGILGLALDAETGRLTGSMMQPCTVPGLRAILAHQAPA